jgi:hypothetical protein
MRFWKRSAIRWSNNLEQSPASSENVSRRLEKVEYAQSRNLTSNKRNATDRPA